MSGEILHHYVHVYLRLAALWAVLEGIHFRGTDTLLKLAPPIKRIIRDKQIPSLNTHVAQRNTKTEPETGETMQNSLACSLGKCKTSLPLKKARSSI